MKVKLKIWSAGLEPPGAAGLFSGWNTEVGRDYEMIQVDKTERQTIRLNSLNSMPPGARPVGWGAVGSALDAPL